MERHDLRIVHAAWIPEAIAEIRDIPLGQTLDVYARFTKHSKLKATELNLDEESNEATRYWKDWLTDKTRNMPFVSEIANFMVHLQMSNPIRVVTSGVERIAESPFFSGGKWRFVTRYPWWNDYSEDIPVIVGHYWRRVVPPTDPVARELDLFSEHGPYDWHGARRNVFCLDYSVGARFKERKEGLEIGTNTHLIAMRWPERELVFDSGHRIPSSQFKTLK